ncbi:MAG: hypothetical protein RMJ15_08965 [Nitrososphaerota archaeon]|nr:hypothetical protein [Nitrososphaerota archaeon]
MLKHLRVGWKVLLPLAMALALALALLAGLNVGRMQGLSASYEQAKKEVYSEAWGAGYVQGFMDGNVSGFTQGYRSGRNEGYREGYEHGVEDGAGRGVSLRDPAYSEVEEFVKLDKTDEMRFSPEGYTFMDLAAKFKTSAMAAGLRCGLTVLLLDNGLAVLNCFNTTDKGMAYVEPWSDRVFTVKPGEFYGAEKVLKVTVVW